jgi:hypothetical protein
MAPFTVVGEDPSNSTHTIIEVVRNKQKRTLSVITGTEQATANDVLGIPNIVEPDPAALVEDVTEHA